MLKAYLEREEAATVMFSFADQVDAINEAFEIKWEEGKAEGIAEGIAEGKLEGKAEGIVEGINQNRVDSIKNLMKTLKLTASQAMNALLIPEAEQAKYLAEL